MMARRRKTRWRKNASNLKNPPYGIKGTVMMKLNALLALFSYKFNPLGHLSVSKHLWRDVVKPGDVVVDATCGNGHDSCFLADLCLQPDQGTLHCIDIQQTAIESARRRLAGHLDASRLSRVQFHHQSHETFPSTVLPGTASLIVYNLGYLPGSDKGLITKTASTLTSLERALELIQEGGMLSVTAYPGHAGGDEETEDVMKMLSALCPETWRVYSQKSLNRPLAPVLACAFRIIKPAA